MKRFKGGSLKARDSWYGIEHADDFKDFKRWYHREEKKRSGTTEDLSAEEARDLYGEWIALGRPKAR